MDQMILIEVGRSLLTLAITWTIVSTGIWFAKAAFNYRPGPHLGLTMIAVAIVAELQIRRIISPVVAVMFLIGILLFRAFITSDNTSIYKRERNW